MFISDRQEVQRPLNRNRAAVQKPNGNAGEQRRILTITKCFIGKLEPTYRDKKVLSENKQFAFFQSLDLALSSPCTHNPLHYEGLCPSANLQNSVSSLPLHSILPAAFKKV